MITRQICQITNGFYVDACKLLRDIHETTHKEINVVAIIAECFAESFFTDDDQCVATKVKQRILKIRCTPILEAEFQI